jgi:hypothetical protein
MMKNMLGQVREAMTVYDREDNKVGTVRFVHFGDEDLDKPGVETATAPRDQWKEKGLIEDLAEAIVPPDRFPPELRSRLQRYGYIRIDTGLLSADRYATADQVADVKGDRVKLSVTKTNLIS